MPNVFNISADLPFLENLAKGVIERFDKGEFSLSDVLILLPNRRSCQYLKEAFQNLPGKKTVIMPKIRPLSDVDEEELTILADEFEIPQAINKTTRLVLLARLSKEYFEKKGAVNFSMAKALNLASELIGFIDEMEREKIPFSELARVVPHELAEHWQITLDFLNLFEKEWPALLEKRGLMNPIARRNQLIENQASFWLKNVPSHPIIIAGSTASTKATLKLIKAVYALPEAYIILPGFDKQCDEEYYAAIGEGHAQAGLKNILEELNVKRTAIKNWVAAEINALKLHFASEVMRPAETTAKWNIVKTASKPQELGLFLSEIEDENNEATLISFIIRDALENRKTTALITNDRNLAALVSNILSRWGINVDDSSGKNLSLSKEAILLRLITETVYSAFAPALFLALLKNPLVRLNYSSKEFRENARKFELLYLRGSRITGGSAEILKQAKDFENIAWLRDVFAVLSPLEQAFAKGNVTFTEILTLSIDALEKMAAPENIWAGSSGLELSSLLNELLLAAEDFSPITANEYSAVLETFLSSRIYRKNFGTTSGITILTPQEARLLKFDVVIMGGLNNGSWPNENDNIWLSRKMQSAISLKAHERLSSLAAHDFYSLLCSNKVHLTRAKKSGNEAKTESSFILRLKTFAACANLDFANAAEFLEIQKSFYIPETFEKLPVPAPNPPVDERINELSVTGFEKLMRDPYSIYASKIIKLNPLAQIDEAPEARDFGNIIHRALQIFNEMLMKGDDAKAEEYFIKAGEQAFSEVNEKNSVYSVWWPRYLGISKEFVEFALRRKKQGGTVFTEVLGKMEILGFKIKAKADRIEVYGNHAAICDYKTGGLPTKSDISDGYAPQMPLEGLILSTGGFEQVPASAPSQMFYVKLFGPEKLEEKIISNSAENMSNDLAAARQGVETLIKMYFKERTAFRPVPVYEKRPIYNDYEHLERIKEWLFG